MRLQLEVIEGPHSGAKFQFERHETFLVGRDPQAQLSLTLDAQSSRHHFMLEFSPPTCVMRDLGSRNGTKVNGQPVKQATLSNGDVISCGKTSLRVALSVAAPRSTLCLSCARQMQLDSTWQADGDATEAYI